MNKKLVDESVFDNLDEEKAVMLGLLMADGCVSPMSGSPSLRLQLIDSGPIYHLQRILKSNHKIQRSTRQLKGYICQPKYRICISGLWYLGPRLEQLGMTHPKPTRFPQKVFPELYCHLLRGYFEGDGSVWWVKSRQTIRTSIYGHLPMLDWIFSVLSRQGIISNRHERPGCFELNFGTCASIRLYHYLYDDASVVLVDRKKRKFEQLLQRCMDQSKRRRTTHELVGLLKTVSLRSDEVI